MAGAIAIVIFLVVVLPVVVLMGGAIGAALFGNELVGDVETSNDGSELVDLNT
jgi:hypothetical protein